MLNVPKVNSSGSRLVTPHYDTTYTLQAVNPVGSASKQKLVSLYGTSPSGTVFYFKMTTTGIAATQCFTIAVLRWTRRRQSESRSKPTAAITLPLSTPTNSQLLAIDIRLCTKSERSSCRFDPSFLCLKVSSLANVSASFPHSFRLSTSVFTQGYIRDVSTSSRLNWNTDQRFTTQTRIASTLRDSPLVPQYCPFLQIEVSPRSCK